MNMLRPGKSEEGNKRLLRSIFNLGGIKGTIAFICLILILIVIILLGISLLLYGVGNDFVDTLETKIGTQINNVGDEVPKVNWGDIEGIDNVVSGQGDLKQQNMAKELLEIYKKVIKEEKDMLEFLTGKIGNEEKAMDYILEIILGIHVTETGTYTTSIRSYWKDKLDYPPGIMLIPSNHVPYSDYGKTNAKYGEIINFTNYDYRYFNDYREKEYEDFKAKNPMSDEEFEKLRRTTDIKSQLFNAGDWSYSFRNFANAMGPLQHVIDWWGINEYVLEQSVVDSDGKTRVRKFVTDVPNYVKTPVTKGNRYTVTKNSDNDIWNFENQVRALYHFYIANKLDNSEFLEITKINDSSVPVEDSLNYFKALIFAGYNGGDGVYSNLKSPDFKTAIDDIYNDKEFLASSKKLFENSGSNSAANDLVKNKMEPYSEPGDSGRVKFKFHNNTENSNYIVKSYVVGISWLDFLKSISSGMRPNLDTGNRNTDRGVVLYNYMNPTNGYKRDLNQTTIQSGMDELNAIGYKGPFPLFNQTLPYNATYRMSGNHTFKSGCTWYAATSAMYGMGVTDKILSFDISSLTPYAHNKDNTTISLLNLWSFINTEKGSRPKDLTKTGRNNGVSTSILGAIDNAGYKTIEYGGPSSSGRTYDNFISHLRSGYPVHIRTYPGNYTGVAPKQAWADIDYSKHNMLDLSLYDWKSPKKIYTLASEGHSIIGVDVVTVDGVDYVSIVDSAYNHKSTYDSNLVWFNAKELFDRDKYSYVYVIVGAETGSLKPIGNNGKVNITGSAPVVSTKTEGSRGEDIYAYIITYNELTPSVVAKDNHTIVTNGTSQVKNINLQTSGIQEIRLGDVNILGLGADKYVYLVTGKIGDNKAAIEIKLNDGTDIIKESGKFSKIQLNSGSTIRVRKGYILPNGEYHVLPIFDETE